MLHVLANFRQLQASSLASRCTYLLRHTRNIADKSDQERPFDEETLDRTTAHAGLSDADVRRVQDVVGAALRKRRAAAEPYVKAHRKYRASAPYKKLVRAFELAEVQKKGKLVRSELWDAYTNARYRLGSELPSLLSEKAWALLWRSQDSIPSNPGLRATRLRLLAADREKAGFTTTFAERIAKVEALFNKGHREEALQQWSDEHNEPTEEGDGFRAEHLSLGIRLYQKIGDWDRTKALLEELYKNNSEYDLKVMDEFIAVHSGRLVGHEEIWELYTWVKSVLNDRMSLAQRESLFGIFHARGFPVHAVTVLEDMIRHEQFGDWTAETARLMLDRISILYAACTDTDQVNEVSLTALSFLPLEYSLVLFKRWLHEIVVRGQTRASTKIVELMYERGLIPRTYHLNLLLMCLWRSNNGTMHSQAEAIALQMLGARRRTLKHGKRTGRQRSSREEREEDMPAKASSYTGSDQTPSTQNENTGPIDADTSAIRKAMSKKIEPFFEKRQVPPADPKTLAQLLQYYTKASRLFDAQQLMEYLDDVEREAEDGPAFLAESSLLDAKVYYYITVGRDEEVWHDIMNMSPGMGMARYNASVYYRLWSDLRNARHIQEHDTSRPDPRALLAHMIEWHQTTHPSERVRISKRFITLATRYTDLPYLVATCFRQGSDLSGALVAMHVLHKHFGLAPTPRMLKALFNQLVALALPTATAEDRRENSRRGGRWGYTMVKMLRLYHNLLLQRVQSTEFAPRTSVIDLEFNPPLEAGGSSLRVFNHAESTLDTLSELIRFIMVRMYDRSDVEKMIEQAKADIGVPDMSTGDVDALHVR
ncbi:hypothetical protein EJ05DRAFT_477849 [Pseudovirgaria hyperparasitica]|uniref:Pentatricopeptide repeat protein n=1 Tax=Pseudovirgaria hyperparasitica TaxID=470096 RepID=A0A6A6W405_9PEZI|nr:uncharacterized protein EJ05DRAFT_477849 [Pseudovirgaria hyperparasitica]KAF2756764.1 hypothetical protein EJ05DRAFT_477849 [Pseudovirgaria hyperparasitica]